MALDSEGQTGPAKGALLSNRAAVALSGAALVVALLGATPIGEAAQKVVPVALFARNAERVDGIDASRRPRAGHLVPLDARGLLPASVVPGTATAGEIGPAGPQGPRGARGPSNGYARYRESVTLSGGEGSIIKFDVPDGHYLVSAKAVFASEATPVDCQLTLGSEVDRVRAANYFYYYNNARALALPFAVVSHRGGTIELKCNAIPGYGMANTTVTDARVMAIAVDDLENKAA